MGASTDRPVVLVTTWRRSGKVWGEWERDMVGTEQFYVTALQNAGISPLLSPIGPTESAGSLLDVVRGLVVIGGEDLSAEISGADPSTIGANASVERDRWEMALLAAALERDLPVLAICRGMQLLNALHGGTLDGDIAGCSDLHPLVPPHIDDALDYRHDVDLSPGSLLSRIYGTERRSVNSLHHQAIDTVGSGLTVTARAADGMIEAVESDIATWCAAMQWHPELLMDGGEKSLFAEFAQRCGA